ncbi:hypothetical protein J0S19_001609, partial [Enterococcus faecalis]|nr:hypothetical protein [Enterococcus faecalis]
DKMNEIQIFDENQKDIGLYTRTNTLGKEYDLVVEFISYYREYFFRYNKRKKLAIFIEPKIESAFPDIVIASYDDGAFNQWKSVRNTINTQDLKILTILIKNKGCKSEYLSELGFSDNQILKSLEKLIDCEMVFRSKEQWKPRRLDSYFGIKQLIAVEAKISDIKSVYSQTLMNTWFASESYALTISKKPHDQTKDMFYEKGLGLYTKSDKFRKIIPAKKMSLPTSYISLQFNEWIGKSLNL